MGMESWTSLKVAVGSVPSHLKKGNYQTSKPKSQKSLKIAQDLYLCPDLGLLGRVHQRNPGHLNIQ